MKIPFRIDQIISEYKRIEKAEDRYDSDEIFSRVIELHVEPIKNDLTGNQEYFVLIGEIYQTIKEYVRSTYAIPHKEVENKMRDKIIDPEMNAKHGKDWKKWELLVCPVCKCHKFDVIYTDDFETSVRCKCGFMAAVHQG